MTVRNGAMTTENEVENSEEIAEKRESFPGYSANKPVYLVRVIDGLKGTVKFVSFKVNHEVSVLKIQGWIVPRGKTIDNLEDAEKHANRDTYFDIQFPWHRVIDIRNITFKRKG